MNKIAFAQNMIRGMINALFFGMMCRCLYKFTWVQNICVRLFVVVPASVNLFVSLLVLLLIYFHFVCLQGVSICVSDHVRACACFCMWICWYGYMCVVMCIVLFVFVCVCVCVCVRACVLCCIHTCGTGAE